MSSSSIVPKAAIDEFWAVVEDCLQEFHGIKSAAIQRKAGKMRQVVERMTRSEQESFYHSEPFDVACEIADNPLNVEDHLARYLHLRDEKHGNSTSKQRMQQRHQMDVEH
jgi:hypothetical protein